VETEDQDIDPTGTGEPIHRSHAGRLILAVIVVTVIAVLLVPGHEDEPGTPLPVQPDDRSSLLDEQATPVSPSRALAPSSQTGTPSTPVVDNRPGTAARRLIRKLRAARRPNLERAWQSARDFEQSGRTDDALVLYFFAAREGHGPAAMKLARSADPASFHEGGLFARANPLQAYKWYGRAAAAGIDEARQALAQLRARVEQAAVAGDEQAQRLMLQWK